MRNKRIYIIALLLLTVLSVAAQTRIQDERGREYKKPKFKTNSAGLYTDQYDGVHHLVGLQVDGAYSTFLQSSDVMSSAPGGYALGASLQYAYLNGPFFIQTGVGVRWQDVKNKVANQQEQRDMLDATSTLSHMTYSFEQRMDETRELYAQIPIYVGGYFHGGYIMGGLKASMPVYGDTRLNMLVSSTAKYDGVIGPIEEMDNHGIRKEVPLTPDQQKGGALKLRFDVLGVIEGGYELAFSNKGKPGYHRSKMNDQRVRIGAFAEFGILNITPKTQNELFVVPGTSPYDFQTFEYNHALSTGQVSSAHNFFAGIRITYFFYGVLSKEKCLLCGLHGTVSPL